MKDLTDCELSIMKVIWDSEEELVLSQIVQQVEDRYGRQWNANTVSTFLSRLVGKGYLTSFKKGRYYLYYRVVSEKDFRAEFINDQIAFWNHGDIAGYVCNILSAQPLSEADFEMIQKKLNELKR